MPPTKSSHTMDEECKRVIHNHSLGNKQPDGIEKHTGMQVFKQDYGVVGALKIFSSF